MQAGKENFDKDFIKDFIEIILRCNVTNTYKMAWGRALVDIACISERQAPETLVKITLEEIAERFLNYYWNHTFFFDLKQGPLQPTIISIVKDLIKRYVKITSSNQPIRYEKLNFEGDLKEILDRFIKELVLILKKDVSHRFLQLKGRDFSWMYDFTKNGDFLYIKAEYLELLKKNNEILYPLINSRWAQIVESFDYSPRISKKIKFLDDIQYNRSSLKPFQEWLDIENPNHECFLCGKAIEDLDLTIDHVIPWSYVFEDNLWNLVYVHRSCNSSKSNIIPTANNIQKLEDRNKKISKIFEQKGFYGVQVVRGKKIAEDLKFALDNNLVQKFWIGCKG